MRFAVRALAGTILATGLSLAAPAEAKSPYYFLDGGNNERPLFSDSGCYGAYVSQCVYFGDFCDYTFWSDPAAVDAANRMLENGEKIFIRENAQPYPVICTIRP